ncbi:PREDICTED: eukaryotic translation initiation factor 4B-like [Dufourea novaeangliae]|uniref:eukaryotic translation initiation factor 4B-like n=1 Tax=Dufourea novaeangliae TaxID=178035 RepID=UPI000766E405|nr:PREDICTED: eukaryotic translation initiation factor 4B-like [Dufourea novaeangliae]
MSSAGKKGKKKIKFKTIGLMSYLADSSTTPTVPMKPFSSWADEMDDDHGGYTSRSSKEPVVLPTAPRAARDPHGVDDDVPTNPPYVAYLSNLPYEVDESYLTEFFADMKISNIRLPKDSNKLRGYGYVEFEDRQSLIDALNLSNTPMKTRRVRIDVSNSVNDDRRGGRMGRDNRRDTYDDPERTSGDWRSGPRDTATQEGDSYRSRYDNRDRRDDRDAPEDNKPGAWRESNDRGRPTFRDRGGFRDDEKDREWSRYDKGSRDRDADRGNSFGPRRNYGDSDYDRDGQRRQGKPPMDSKPESRSRPKLQLQPRTKPIEAAVKEDQQPAKDTPSAPPHAPSAPAHAPSAPANTPSAPASAPSAPENAPSDPANVPSAPTNAPSAPANVPSAPANAPSAPAHVPSTNIFGAAKPVDTTAREREIEERLAKSYAESKSRDEGDTEKRGKDGTWGRRNGEGRDDRDKDRYIYSRGPPSSSRVDRGGAPSSRGPPRSNDTRAPDRDRRDREKDDTSRMPKAKDEQAPNFVASNKYSMLPGDVDPDNIDDYLD